MMFCSNCGTQLPDGAKFCFNCGSQILSNTAPKAPAPQQTAPSQPAPPRVNPPQPTPQAPPQPQPQQPMYNQPPQQQRYNQPPPQKMYNQPMYRQPAYGGAPPKAKKKGSPLVPILIVVIVLGLIAAIVTPLVIFKVLKKQNSSDSTFGKLCDTTRLGVRSYSYARMLTEQLLETDLATADPQKMDKLFDECLSAWDAVGQVSDAMGTLSAKVTERPSDGSKSASAVITAIAADGSSTLAVTLNESESAERCQILSSQMAEDANSCTNYIQQLRALYHGRSTSLSDWNQLTESTVLCFNTIVFFAGEITDGDGTAVSENGMRSIRTLTTSGKNQPLTVDGADVVVDVNSLGSVFVIGGSNTVNMNYEELEPYLSSNSTAISVSNNTADVNERAITFHAEPLCTWFQLSGTGAFTITRGNKHESPPEDPPVITEGNPGTTGNEPPRGPISELLPPGGSTDTINELNNINGSSSETTTEPPTEEPTQPVDLDTLTIRCTDEGAGTGTITVSLLWGTHDDLDLHMDTPDGSHIYYGDKTAGGGTLDVDMNANSYNLQDSPIENIYFPTPAVGHYKVSLRDYCDRTSQCQTHYLVRVIINGEEHVYEGDIDGSGTEIVIMEFDYVIESGNITETQPLDENSLNQWLTNAGAGSGDITVSMAWDTWDDVDLHIINPDESHISYSCKSAGGGTLDVDANAGSERILTPVENIYYAQPQNGHYKVYIHDFADRTDGTTNYIVKVTIGGQSQTFTGTIDGTGTDITIIEFDYGGAPTDQGGESFSGHRYKYFDVNMTWTEARAYCRSLGGHLATITSEEEQAFIDQTYPGCKGFIGFFGEGESWQWITGETWSYTRWKSGEPNNQDGNEWVGHLWGDGTWNDLPNEDTSYHSGFLCEWDDNLDNALEQGLISAGASSGEITISLGWDSIDDFDLHVFAPDGTEIYFGNPEDAGGVMDVDANRDEEDATTTPVENIYFAAPVNGEYWVYIDNYEDRTPGSPANYLVRVKLGDDVKEFRGTLEGTDEVVEVAGFQYTGAQN